MIQLQNPVSLGDGVTVSGVSIECIVPHEHGAQVILHQAGMSVQVAHKDAPEGFGDARVNKTSGLVTLNDIASAIPAAIVSRYGGEA